MDSLLFSFAFVLCRIYRFFDSSLNRAGTRFEPAIVRRYETVQFAFRWNFPCRSANHLVIAKLRKWSQNGNASRETILRSKPLRLRIGRRGKPSLQNPAIEVGIAFALDQAVRFVAKRFM